MILSRRKRAWGLVLLMLALLYGFRTPSGPVQADHDSNPDISDIALTAPQTYMLCPTGAESNVVALSNVGTRWLRGYVQLDFVIPDGGGRQMVQRWDVLQGGDYRLEIVYPAWETWPVEFFEMHVDLVFEVYPTEVDARAGTNLLGTIGPGHPWDIFCLAARPTATIPPPSVTPTVPPSTPTPSPTPVSGPPTMTPNPSPTSIPPVAPPIPPAATPMPSPTVALDGELLGRTGGEGIPIAVPLSALGLLLWIAVGLIRRRNARRQDPQ